MMEAEHKVKASKEILEERHLLKQKAEVELKMKEYEFQMLKKREEECNNNL